MSTEDTAKALGSAFAFSSVAWLSDVISAGLGSMQINVTTALFGGPQAIATGGAIIIAGIVDFIAGTDIVVKTAAGFTVFLGIQALVSLLTLCVFYALVLASPKGTYTLSDCLVAAGIFLLEAAPFLCSFVFWGGFATYLKRREISGVTETFSSVAGLPAAKGKDGGGLKGVLTRKLGSLKR